MKNNLFGILAVGIGLLLVAGPAFGLSFGNVSTASVAQGNVYDIYATGPSGQGSTLVASCQSFAYMLSLQAANPNNSYSGIPDANCGPIIIVTSTTISGTTFTNAASSGSTVTVIGGSTSTVTVTQGGTTTTSLVYYCGNIQYNPAQQTCNAQTSTVTNTQTSTVTNTSTSTTTALTTSVITVTQSGTTTTKTVTQTATGNGLPFGLALSQLLGFAFIAIGGATFIARRPKG